jgi:hypothetical protein
MLTILLFITIIICGSAFTKNVVLKPRLNLLSKTKLNVRLTSTSFYKDDDGNDRRKKNYNYDYNYNYDLDAVYDPSLSNNAHSFIPMNNEEMDMDMPETLYTLI